MASCGHLTVTVSHEQIIVLLNHGSRLLTASAGAINRSDYHLSFLPIIEAVRPGKYRWH
jgi:hypothetical protein